MADVEVALRCEARGDTVGALEIVGAEAAQQLKEAVGGSCCDKRVQRRKQRGLCHHCYPGLFVGMNEDHSRSSGMVLILCDSVNQGNHMSLYNLKL